MILENMSERVMGFGNYGNAQATLTGDAGGTATTLAVSRARAVHAGGPEANRMTELKPTIALSPMFSNEFRGALLRLAGNAAKIDYAGIAQLVE